VLPRSLELRGIIKRTDDHIFEKILKIELSPIPPPFSSTNETDRYDITEILLKVALNTMKPTNQPNQHCFTFKHFYGKKSH
jgi:hypothetical protein